MTDVGKQLTREQGRVLMGGDRLELEFFEGSRAEPVSQCFELGEQLLVCCQSVE